MTYSLSAFSETSLFGVLVSNFRARIHHVTQLTTRTKQPMPTNSRSIAVRLRRTFTRLLSERDEQCETPSLLRVFESFSNNVPQLEGRGHLLLSELLSYCDSFRYTTSF